MNIFATDPCPYQSAANLDDKRVVKMCLETAQMLSTAALVLWRYEDIFDAPLLKPAYQKHPCTLWAGENTHHFYWLVQHGIALCELYTRVYGKIHKNAQLIRWFSPCTNRADCLPPWRFANCTRNEAAGVDFKHVEDTHLAYRMYLNARWAKDKRSPTWQGRPTPSFLESA